MTARSGPVGVGIIGAGVISGTYLDNLTSFPDTRVVAVGDLFPEVAERQAAAYGVERAGGIDAVLDNDDVEIVVNLTVPIAHAQVATQALDAGRHVWNEKPLTLDRPSAQALLKRAELAGLRIGCAPDTFLGAGLQTARRMVERGEIGDLQTALVLFQAPGPESWHPNPAFLFQEGAGPLFDLGPYYWTALVQTFGPVAEVAAAGARSRETRVIGSGPKAGEEFAVTVPTHVGTLVRFESGHSAQAIFSFDSALPRTLLEVSGADGTMIFPDPNMFDGDVVVHRRGAEVADPPVSTTAKSQRGTGVLDMARSLRADQPHRGQGALAYHVLDIMVSVSEAVDSGQFVSVDSTVTLPDLLPEDWDPLTATL